MLGSSAASDLGTAPLSSAYVGTHSDMPSIFMLGTNGKADVAYTTMWWHANYDTVTPGAVTNPAVVAKTLPPSLYLAAAPAWWPSGTAWPWVGPDLYPRVGTLPAKSRSDLLGP